MKDWAYARLTHDAAQAGGVDEYVAMIHQAGFLDGKTSMYPNIPIALVVGWLLKLGYDKAVVVYRGWREERERLKSNEEIAKSQLENMCAPNSPCKREDTSHD